MNEHVPAPLRAGAGLAAVALAAAAYIVLSSVRWAIQSFHPLPCNDGWASPLFWKWHREGVLNLKLLLGLHNEHRMLFPRLFFLADNAWFQGRGVFLLATMGLIQALHAALWIAAGRRWLGLRGATLGLFAALIISLAFWAVQREDIFWPFQVQFILPFFAASASFLCFSLAFPPDMQPSPSYFASSLFATLIASYSIASGLLLWPVLFLAALAWRIPRRFLSWLGLTALGATALYLHHYQSPTGLLGQPLDSLRRPLGMLAFACTYLGAPFGEVHSPTGLALGASGIAAGLSAFWFVPARLRRSGVLDLARGWLLFGLASALATAFGRLPLGPSVAYQGHYQTAALFFWCGLLVFAFAALEGARRPARLGASCLVLVLLSFVVLRQHQIARDGWDRFSSVDNASLALITGVEDAASLDYTLPATGPLFEWAVFLKLERLSIYAEDWPSWLGRKLGEVASVEQERRFEGEVEWVGHAGTPEHPGLRLTGWALDTKGSDPVDLVLVIDEEWTIVGFGRGQRRTAGPVDWRGPFSGWSGYVRGGHKGPLSAYAVDRRHRRAWPLGPCPPARPGIQSMLGRRLQDRFRVVDPGLCRGHVDHTIETTWGQLRRVHSEGWAWIPGPGQAQEIVLADASGVIQGYGHGGIGRPEIGRVFQDASMAASGWRAIAENGHLDDTLAAYAVLEDGQSVCRLNDEGMALIGR